MSVYVCVCLWVCSEVSCKTLEGLDGLKRLVYNVACTMKLSSSSASGHKLLGRLVSGRASSPGGGG